MAAVLLAATAILAWLTIPRATSAGEENTPAETPRADMEHSVR